MKILLVSEDIPEVSMGGLAKHVLILARALAEAGHQVDLLCNAEQSWDSTNPELNLPGRIFRELRGYHRGWKELTLGCFMPPRRALTSRAFARHILAHADAYDVVHYHGHVPDVGAFIPDGVNFVQTRHDQGSDCLIHLRFRAGAPCREIAPRACASCVSNSPNALQQLVSGMAVAQFRERVGTAFRRHKTIFVSDFLRRNLCRTLGGQPSDWGEVIHTFLATRDIPKLPTRPPNRAERRVFGAGKLYGPKGFPALFAELAPRLPEDMIVGIAGGGPDEARLRAAHNDRRYRFLGWCDFATVMRETAEADFIVMPSIWEEPCSSTVLEGLALGKPVYALNRGGPPELARYEMYPGQLRLFDDMASLAEALVAARPVDRQVDPAAFTGTVARRLPEILAVYQAPARAWT